MLWVTIAIVKLARSSSISSSMCAVAIGSSAEHGSSIRITSGLTAIARAMHRRCCWPPERLLPGWSSRSLTSFHKPGAPQGGLDDLVHLGLAAGEPVDARAVGDVVVDRLGERVGLLEHHADPGAQLHHVDVGCVDVLAVEADVALDPAAVDGVVHPVEAAQEGRLAAARRADQRGHLALRDRPGRRRTAPASAVPEIDVRAPTSSACRRGRVAGCGRRASRAGRSWSCYHSARTSGAGRPRRAFISDQEAQQHHDRGRGPLGEGALRAVGPDVDLHRQRGGGRQRRGRARRR